MRDSGDFPRFRRSSQRSIGAQASTISMPLWRGFAASGAEVSLPGFGKFKVKAAPEREGRNPANGEKIKIAASKKLIFSSAKSVKDLPNR
jgi:nucleoid DNA-binding protein